MNTVFLINDVLIFEPDERRLGDLHNYPARAITLHVPVSECLRELLEHNNQLVTQHDLFAAVWTKQGAVVTTNALYQTIASIRRSLRTAGLTDNIIKTVPKEGFKSVAQLRTGPLELFLSGEKYHPEPLIPVRSSVPLSTESSMPSRARRQFSYALIAALAILSWTLLWIHIPLNESRLSQYHFVGTVAGCQLYSSWDQKEKSEYTFRALMQRHPIPCETEKMAWLTLNNIQRGISVLLCDKPPDNRLA
jgi:DNA-binding winged helix-turn-helix (wHTH) protein